MKQFVSDLIEAEKKVQCKMSVFIEKYDSEANYCALATLVKCEGLREDSNNCPYWKRVGE